VIEHIVAETGFSGVVRVDRGETTEFAAAYGLAHRGHGIANTVHTRFAIASGTKGLTALTVVSLIVDGRLDLATTARSVLGADLPLIDDSVTIEQLLAHRSGIGDYYDEESDVHGEYLAVGVRELTSTSAYLSILDGYPAKFPPGARFAYCNSGYVVLALIAERVGGASFAELVRERVTEPAGMVDTAFLRSDEPDGRMALGYLASEGLRTNVMHLPVVGTGDGGIYSTAADVHALWSALHAGRIVPDEWVAEMVRPRSDVPKEKMRHGLGFWLHATRDIALLNGFDPGVSLRTCHDPAQRLTCTVVSNTAAGAWPVARALESELGVGAG
jgi:CubicO group peptidase (beta-lactamase class C family)